MTKKSTLGSKSTFFTDFEGKNFQNEKPIFFRKLKYLNQFDAQNSQFSLSYQNLIVKLGKNELIISSSLFVSLHFEMVVGCLRQVIGLVVFLVIESALAGTDYKVQSSCSSSMLLTPPCERLFTPPERKLHSISIDDGMLSQFKSLSS